MGSRILPRRELPAESLCWAWLANGVTYTLISAGLGALMLMDWLNRLGMIP